MAKSAEPSERTIGRLSLYRALLNRMLRAGESNVYSHQIADAAGATPAQVRRDLMEVGYHGSAAHGYDTRELIRAIGAFLDGPCPEQVALVGIGNLGRAIIEFFRDRRPNLRITVAFDRDRFKVNRMIGDCRCYHVEEMPRVVRQAGIRTAIVAVPVAAAQQVAEQLVTSGVRGLLHFAPVRLHLPEGVFVENMDVAASLEKVAYFARRAAGGEAAEPSAGDANPA